MNAAVTALLDVAPLRRILTLLNADDEEARLVGGAVRNALLARPVHEYDIATTALPTIVMDRASHAGLRAIPTGIAHGTITVLVAGVAFEITTLREDVETDGRHAVIRFGRDFAADAHRRDFTINALSMGLDGQVYDYTGGLDDIAARRVRFIGEPDQRIREDFLRVLRFFRFSASYGEGPLDPHGFAACIRRRHGLAILSRERVRQELLKLLVAPRAAFVADAMTGAGLLGPLLLGVPQPARLAGLASVETAEDAILRLAALGVQVVEDADRLHEALRLSNQEHARLRHMAKALAIVRGQGSPPRHGDLRRLLFVCGRAAACDGLRLAQAEAGAGADDPAWLASLAFVRDTPEPRLPFTSTELMARGLKGSALGQALKTLQARWIRAGFPQDPRALATLLEDLIDAPRD